MPALSVLELSLRSQKENDHKAYDQASNRDAIHDDSFQSLPLKLKGDFRPRRSLAKADIFIILEQKSQHFHRIFPKSQITHLCKIR